MSFLGTLRRLTFGISPDETTFSRRGFPSGTSPARPRLEQVGQSFVTGYHAALAAGDPSKLTAELDGSLDPELQGFVIEGSAMAFALLDLLTPWKRDRLQTFLTGPGAPHLYMIHVGAGWALARLGRSLDKALAHEDPLLRWLIADGYGFHEGYFHWKRSFREHRLPAHISGYALRAFDQGLGRSLWFVDGADPERIGVTMASFAPERRSDLWSGLGLACAYAGGVERRTIHALQAMAGMNRPSLAQGAAFAAKARQRAGNPAPHTELACEILCGMSAHTAAASTDAALVGLPEGGSEPAYETWRSRIRSAFSEEVIPS